MYKKLTFSIAMQPGPMWLAIFDKHPTNHGHLSLHSLIVLSHFLTEAGTLVLCADLREQMVLSSLLSNINSLNLVKILGNSP